jgi:multidrug efflux pump subunit AcrB
MISVSFLQRKKAALCILAGICSLSVFIIFNRTNRIDQKPGMQYVIKIRHYGLDADAMENSITIPMEDALSAIQGIMSIQSSSENSLSRIFIRFKPDIKGRYEAVRDAVQRIYENLPSSVQRPEILSSDDSRVPVWSAAVFSGNEVSSHTLEKIIKPRFESLDGAGEVLISGIGQKEINIILDQEKIANIGLTPFQVASCLGNNDSVFSGGSIIQGNYEITVSVDSRYVFSEQSFTNETNKLENALIHYGNGNIVSLSEIALITETDRKPDILSRLNGKKVPFIAIMASDNADLRKLSKNIKRELNALSSEYQFTVLSDIGDEESKAFTSVLTAALYGAILAAFISYLFNLKQKRILPGVFCAFAIPSICLITAGILSVAGFTINRLLLTGIAAGTGTAVDSVILCSEELNRCANYSEASASMSKLFVPLFSGAATTIAALIPLIILQNFNAGIIAISIICVTGVSLFMSLWILPSLLLWDLNKKYISKFTNTFIFKSVHRISRFFIRMLSKEIEYCMRYPIIVILIAIFISVSALVLLFIKGVDVTQYSSENSIYAQVEFEPGLIAEEADLRLASYADSLCLNPGIKNIETRAQTGSGTILISFNPKIVKSQDIQELAKQTSIPGGFVFFHENAKNDRYLEIRISGDEDGKCRELAKELSALCGGYRYVKDIVFNFKEGSKKIKLTPDRARLQEAGILFSNVGSSLRLGVFGPVAYKRVSSLSEIDLRIKTETNIFEDKDSYFPTRDKTLNIPVIGQKNESFSIVPVKSVMNTHEGTEPSSIRRVERRRSASITIITPPKDPRRTKADMGKYFKRLKLPPGYSIDFDPEVIKQADNLSLTLMYLLLAILFCYMIMASINESFSLPLIVLASVPPSLSVPALFIAVLGNSYNSAIACSFMAVSGMTVNAAALCVDEIKKYPQAGITVQNMYSSIRRKIPALLATTGTTIAGSLPFIFLKEGANSLIQTLSLVNVLGVFGSFLCSITVIPAIFFLINKNRHLKKQI